MKQHDELKTLAIKVLKPYPQNARTHSDEQIEQIANSITEFGFTAPVLVDESNTILAGHGRVEAAKTLGMDSVPCVIIKGLTANQKRAYVLADNQVALGADWDEAMLQRELAALAETDIDPASFGFVVENEIDDGYFEPRQNQEVNTGDFDLKHQCPKCKYEFN